MDKLTIGIIIDEHYLPTSGGGFSYYRSLLRAINGYEWDSNIEIVNIIFYKNISKQTIFTKRTLLIDKNYIYSVSYLYHKTVHAIFRAINKSKYKKVWNRAAMKILALRNKNTERILRKNKIDLIYYLKAEETCMNYPFIATHWDVGHRSMYSFPEMALDGNYETRENYYTTILNKAFLIICESETGARELLNFYAINSAKIKIMPIFSGDVVRQQAIAEEQAQVLKKYGLEKNNFFLYPAQFWAHKNHYNLLHAFCLLSPKGNNRLKLVLPGSDKGNLAYIKEQINQLGAAEQVILPGYISDKELYILYKNTIALVMPTFLGPTNIPLIEAAELQCPVLCSDLEGHREILQDAALYFNPVSAADIMQCMQTIKDDPATRMQLIARADQQVAASSFKIEKSLQLLEQILLEARPIRKTWGFSHMLFYLLTCSSAAV